MSSYNLADTVEALQQLLNSGEVEAYDFISELDDDIRDDLYGATYAYNANKDAITSDDTLVDLYNAWGISPDSTHDDIGVEGIYNEGGF